MPAPAGKDAGPKVWLCHIEVRGAAPAPGGCAPPGVPVDCYETGHEWSVLQIRSLVDRPLITHEQTDSQDNH
jgi:hypothetical protein